jgi:hypothetical protein
MALLQAPQPFQWQASTHQVAFPLARLVEGVTEQVPVTFRR